MKEMVWVDFELAPYKNAEGQLPGRLNYLRELTEKLVGLITAFKDDRFAVSKNMLLTLYLIFNPSEADNVAKSLPKKLSDSSEFNGLMQELMVVCEDEQCKYVLVGVQAWCVKGCMNMAGGYADGVHQRTVEKALLFKQQYQGTLPIDKEDELEKENKSARDQYKKVSEFCAKYKLAV